MKEYLKYCTVSELKDQITDTLSSAKQKLSHVSASRRRNDPSLVNKKFYSYVNEIKNKQEEYDLLMNQTNEIEILLNRRKNKINESLEKYQRNKRSKTLTSFYRNQRVSEYYDDIKKMKENLLATASNLSTNIQSKVCQDNKTQTTKQRYQTQPHSIVHANAKSMLIDQRNKKIEVTSDINKRKSSLKDERRRLKSIQNVVNINIDNKELKNYQKLYSFAKNTIKSEVKKYPKQNNENSFKDVQKQLKLETQPNQRTQKKQVPIPQSFKKQKKTSPQHKAMKMIKGRIKQNQNNSEVQWQTNKRLENTKSLLLKHQYQTFLRRDLKMKLISSLDVFFKMQEIHS